MQSPHSDGHTIEILVTTISMGHTSCRLCLEAFGIISLEIVAKDNTASVIQLFIIFCDEAAPFLSSIYFGQLFGPIFCSIGRFGQLLLRRASYILSHWTTFVCYCFNFCFWLFAELFNFAKVLIKLFNMTEPLDEEYIVEQILDKRLRNGKIEYLLAWKGEAVVFFVLVATVKSVKSPKRSSLSPTKISISS